MKKKQKRSESKHISTGINQIEQENEGIKRAHGQD
jgi:hypothetical protein